jgi:glycosyltransferase involved in cell wall biosynthesis
LRSATQNGDPFQHYHEGLRLQQELGRSAVQLGFGNADALYCMMDEFGPLLPAARAEGLKVVSELYIRLSTDRIMNRERKDFPGWDDCALDYDSLDRQMRPNRPLFTSVDCAICPSESVRDDAVQNFGFLDSRTAVVPYGANPELLALRNQPVPGRVLFAGTAELRKGIHYFAMAAEQLRGRGFEGEFRVAGNVSSNVLQQPVCRQLTFLGRVPRAEMSGEFVSTDVLALPSLAEGSAEVTYEALACGVPVITTPEAGSVVRDGIDGRIVPSRDPAALADAIAEIVEDRNLRDRMAHNARERARDYTWERYGERLVTALKSFRA